MPKQQNKSDSNSLSNENSNEIKSNIIRSNKSINNLFKHDYDNHSSNNESQISNKEKNKIANQKLNTNSSFKINLDFMLKKDIKELNNNEKEVINLTDTLISKNTDSIKNKDSSRIESSTKTNKNIDQTEKIRRKTNQTNETVSKEAYNNSENSKDKNKAKKKTRNSFLNSNLLHNNNNNINNREKPSILSNKTKNDNNKILFNVNNNIKNNISNSNSNLNNNNSFLFFNDHAENSSSNNFNMNKNNQNNISNEEEQNHYYRISPKNYNRRNSNKKKTTDSKVNKVKEQLNFSPEIKEVISKIKNMGVQKKLSLSRNNYYHFHSNININNENKEKSINSKSVKALIKYKNNNVMLYKNNINKYNDQIVRDLPFNVNYCKADLNKGVKIEKQRRFKNYQSNNKLNNFSYLNEKNAGDRLKNNNNIDDTLVLDITGLPNNHQRNFSLMNPNNISHYTYNKSNNITTNSNNSLYSINIKKNDDINYELYQNNNINTKRTDVSVKKYLSQKHFQTKVKARKIIDTSDKLTNHKESSLIKTMNFQKSYFYHSINLARIRKYMNEKLKEKRKYQFDPSNTFFSERYVKQYPEIAGFVLDYNELDRRISSCNKRGSILNNLNVSDKSDNVKPIKKNAINKYKSRSIDYDDNAFIKKNISKYSIKPLMIEEDDYKNLVIQKAIVKEPNPKRYVYKIPNIGLTYNKNSLLDNTNRKYKLKTKEKNNSIKKSK